MYQTRGHVRLGFKESDRRDRIVKFRFNIHHQAQWSSTLHDAPELPEVPAMQRRRLSRLTKMALRVCFDLPDASALPSVFASRHGEISRTLTLLNQIIAGEPLSPAAFSQSVHNTASGTYAIQAHNRHASSALCAGAETLPMALLEAWSISQHQQTPVLLVYADEPQATCYQLFQDEQGDALALGWIIEAHPQGQIISEWRSSPIATSSITPSTAPMSLAWQWWQHQQSESTMTSVICRHPQGEWHWHVA